ncbi:MAG TPA: response regulator transcription factor [Bacteroidetes bacterium]|nr:response regulator transcription factor [Bacteroidota bacterium]
MNTIIVDDEPLALDVLETYVEKIPDLNLVARCNNAFEANEALKEHDIDLMFLDIQMPQLTGIDFVKTLTDPPLVIFTTAYSNYAIEGFELNATDYLLKPISLERFIKSVNKAVDQINLRRKENAAHIEDTGPEAFTFVKADKKFIKVKYSEVLYIEGLKDYVIIRMEKGRVITLQTMKSLEQKLPQKMFKRIHRSYIVNIDQIQAVLGNMVEVIEKGKPKPLPMGKNYRENPLELINKNRL